MAATYLGTVGGGKQGYAPCRILLSRQIFWVGFQYYGDDKTVTRFG